MATILNEITETVKKVANASKNSEPAKETSKDSWIGTGVSPTTGEKTYSTASASKNSNNSSYDEDLQRLKRLQQEATAQQLKAQKEKTLQALAEQEAEVKPRYQAQRNSTAAVSAKNARSFNEYLANRGLTNSGAAVQAESNRMSTLQNNLANIDTQETNALNEIARARRNAETDYATGLASANAQIEADYFSKLVEENQRQRQIDEQLKQQALGQYSDDYMARRNELIAQGYSPDSREVLMVDAARGNKMLDFTASTKQNALQQILAGNINYNTAKYAGFNSVEEAMKYYNDAKAAAEAEALKEAEETAWKRKMEENKYNLDYQNTMSLIDSRKNGGSGNDEGGFTRTLDEIETDLSYYQTDDEKRERIYNLETAGIISKTQAQQLFTLLSL